MADQEKRVRKWGALQELGWPKSQTNEYEAMWLRDKKRRDPEYAEICRERVRIYRKTKGRDKWVRNKKEWNLRNRKKYLAYFRRRNRNRRKCFACHSYRKGRRMQTIERLVPLNGKLVMRKVLYCGEC